MVKERFTIGATDDMREIRHEVFEVEQGFHDEFDDLDSSCWCLVLYLDGYPISCGRIVEQDPETYLIQRVAVRAPFRGKKVGTYTMKYLMNKILSLGGRIALVHAQYDKLDFYKKLGFREYEDGEVHLEEGYPHIYVRKYLGKKRR